MDAKLWISNILVALLLIIIAPNGHILANIAIVSQFSLAIDLSSKGLPGQLQIFKNKRCLRGTARRCPKSRPCRPPAGASTDRREPRAAGRKALSCPAAPPSRE